VQADRIILATLALSALIAVALGLHFGQAMTAIVGAAALLALGASAALTAGGSLAARLVLSGSLMAMTALHIQLGRGTLELHFGVFVTLGVLLVYQD